MTAKLSRERALLRAAYNESDFAAVEHQDKPDFVLRHHGQPTSFGVEVTDIFETEADARVRGHPEYVSRLLAGGRHMHRDDLEILQVGSVTVRAQDGTVKADNVPAILRKSPTYVQHYEAVAAALLRKDARVEQYRPGLSHVNLVVGDRFGPAPEVAADGAYAAAEVLIPPLRDALLSTGFREVFLVSTNVGRQSISRPLQQLLLLDTFYMFCAACESFPGDSVDGPDLELSDLVPTFVHVLSGSGMRVGLARHTRDSMCATYRGAGVALTEAGVELLDFHDLPIPASVPLPALRVSEASVAMLREHYEAFRSANRFSCALARDPGNETT
ncbi:MAG: hypothetical protein M3443_10830 [Actinomycetota bacterium]|nr:hypothetical protein [Actinomycetota bacterium]